MAMAMVLILSVAEGVQIYLGSCRMQYLVLLRTL
jgi:hypothetical protein